jgi:Domain of unknown function (DUF5615)
MDHHVPPAITAGLQARGVDVITAYEDSGHTLDDPMLLDRASELGRVLFTQDDDLLREATRRQRASIPFNDIIYGSQRLSIGQCVDDLEIIAKAGVSEDLANRVGYLPLSNL